MRGLALGLALLMLILQAGASRAQTACPPGVADLSQQKLEIQVLQNKAPPSEVGGQVILGYDGCLRFNPGDSSMPYYAGQVTLLFFDTSYNFLTATGQQLWAVSGNTLIAIPVQNPHGGQSDAHMFGSSWPVSFKVDVNAISAISVMELQITQCSSPDLNTCDARKTSTWLWTGQYFNPAPIAPRPLQVVTSPPNQGVYNVSDQGPPCAATQPREGAAIAQATMVATDVIPTLAKPVGNERPAQVLDPGYTSIGIIGCLRFNSRNPKQPEASPVYPYYGLGAVGALLFDSEGNVLTPTGDPPGKPYGQFVSIFPASSAVAANATDPTPILNPMTAGIHAFGFEYKFPLIAHQAISPYATLVLSVRGCTDNVTSSCTGPVETFVHTVRTCFSELQRPLPHRGKGEDCSSYVGN